jgi:DNA-binding HxlR family transcriptional regulator
MRPRKRRSFCPMSSALDCIGDKWSLLIVRDILLRGKRTHGQFRASAEKIATNILGDRLAWLEEHGIVSREVDPTDARSEIYSLTKKGVDFLPVLLSLSEWSAKYDDALSAGPNHNRLNQLLKDMRGLMKESAAGVDLRQGRVIFET